jgi:putative flippase GtrA
MSNHNRAVTGVIQSFARRRILRFALVGGAGIPINIALLWLLHEIAQLPIVPAWMLAFECCVLINFYANQRFTFHEQQHLRGWDWPKRALKAQLTTLVGVGINIATFGMLLAAGMHYVIADTAGIIAAFAANFTLARRFVFTPPAPASSEPHLLFSNAVDQ